MKKVFNKILDVSFNLYVELIILWFSKIKKTINTELKGKGIMALPYYSENYPGGHSRIGDWKVFFNSDQVEFDVFWASESNFFLKAFYSKNPFLRYWFFLRVLQSRISCISKLNCYEAIWIQRAFIPFYPFKKDKFESLITRIHPNVIIDYYDADYESNFDLTVNSAKNANKVTVASLHLLKYFNKINERTLYIPFAIKHEDYTQKKYQNNQQVTIGWMGSPGNFNNILYIENELLTLEKLHPNISFIFICREKFDMKLERVCFKNWDEESFDYHKTIQSFDIGLAPMIEKTERNLAKTAFKSLEYMSSGLAFVSSPWGIPAHLTHEESVLIAKEKKDWITHINRLITDFNLRQKIGKNAHEVIVGKFSYMKVYENLKKTLLNQSDKDL